MNVGVEVKMSGTDFSLLDDKLAAVTPFSGLTA